jgi:hypothetical protein
MSAAVENALGFFVGFLRVFSAYAGDPFTFHAEFRPEAGGTEKLGTTSGAESGRPWGFAA